MLDFVERLFIINETQHYVLYLIVAVLNQYLSTSDSDSKLCGSDVSFALYLFIVVDNLMKYLQCVTHEADWSVVLTFCCIVRFRQGDEIRC